MIVVDASLATKWFLAETDSRAAISLLDVYAGRIHGPGLLTTEVGQALVAAANSRRIDRATALTLLASWLNTVDEGISLHPVDDRLIKRAAGIALDLGHPLADCIYLVLALDLGVDLATCDAKFAKKARAIYPAVKLLADYGN